jgi:hypothetical protein
MEEIEIINTTNEDLDIILWLFDQAMESQGWCKQYALQSHLKLVRMDTWADNKKLIDYYKSFGFEFIENYKTPDSPELLFQNRNLCVALLEMKLNS